MEEEARILDALRRAFPEGLLAAGESLGEAVAVLRSNTLPGAVELLRAEPFRLTTLLDLTCIHYPDRDGAFELVYHLLSLASSVRVRLKISLPAADPVAPTLTEVWKNADWLEREVFDMFGVRFAGHPDLRRLLLYDGFEGHPLRKDYPYRKRQPVVSPPRGTAAAATRLERRARPESLLLNMGPSHPAMHGTVRILLELDGERVLNSEVEIGYLHRGFEKTCENKTYFNLLIYTDRLNYVSPLINNVGYVMAVEKMFGLEVPERAQVIRVLMSELSRVSDHLTCLAAMAMESGAFTVFLYNMKAREFLWDVIEQTTGTRMTTSYVRVGGVRADLHSGYGEAARTAVRETRAVLKDVKGLLDRNKIFLDRTRDVAVMSRENAVAFGWTGPTLRSTGIAYDVRKARPYLVYDRLQFDVPVGDRGDNYDRYLVRMREMEQSLRLIEQCVGWLERMPASAPAAAEGTISPADAIRAGRAKRPNAEVALSPNLQGAEKSVQNRIYAEAPRSVPPSKQDVYTTMEGLIGHFHHFMKGYGIRPPRGEVYFSVEGGNGELGYFIVSDGTDRPYRLHLRAPCFHSMAALEMLIRGCLVADIIPTFGSLNMIGGELDR